jgi:hypothetical protein
LREALWQVRHSLDIHEDPHQSVENAFPFELFTGVRVPHAATVDGGSCRERDARRRCGCPLPRAIVCLNTAWLGVDR